MKSSFNNIQLSIIIAIVLAILPSLAIGKAKHEVAHSVSTADQRKAEYIFLEAQNEKSHDRADSYYDLLNYAHDIDPYNSTIAFYLGHSLLTMNNTSKQTAEYALELMRQHFEQAPDDLYETLFYSDANLQLGHPDEALRALKRLNEQNPNKIELQVRLAEAYARTGDFTRSNATYDSIAALHGRSIQITGKKLTNYVALGDSAAALTEMRTLLATAPHSATYNMAMGSVLEHFGQRDSALIYLERAQAYEPDNGYTYMALAQYYNEMGDSVAYDKQIYQALTTPSLDVDTKLTVLVSYVRDLLMQQDSTQRVSQLFDVLLDQHPHEASIRNLYSEYLVARQDYKGAAEQLSYSLALNPTDADEWRRLMIINMMDENFPAAIQAAEKSLEYNPDSLDLYSYIAPAYFQMHQYDLALDTYDKALAMVDSLDLETRSNLVGGKGDVYFEMGDTTLAFQTYEQALALYPGNTSIMNNYAYFLALCGKNLDKAESMAAKAVKDEPDNATFIDTYAWVYFVKHDYKMALFYIKSAIDKDITNSSDLRAHYGDILYFNNELEQAIEQWQQALELDPSNELLQRKVKFKTYFEQ